MKKGTFIILAIVCFFACSDSRYKSAENVAELSISFIDQNWDGKDVPTSGQCRSCDGKGLSPALLVKNIPENTDVLIVEFEDTTFYNLTAYHYNLHDRQGCIITFYTVYRKYILQEYTTILFYSCSTHRKV